MKKIPFEKYVAYPIGLLVAFSLFSVVLLSIGINPLSAFQSLLYGSFGTTYNISETFVKATPLLLCALAFTIGVKAGFWNIGGEGQLYMGALAAVLLASQLGDLPSSVSIFLVGLTSFFAGVVWLAIPIFLRVKFKINEIFVTVALNFTALYVIGWLCTGPLKDPLSVNPQTPIIPSTTWLLKILPGTRLHAGIILAVVFAILVYLLLYRTTLGYRIRVTGTSSVSARYAGINLSKVITIAAVLSGGLAGLAGMGEVLGTHHLLIEGISPGYGFQGIVIAALVRFNPIGGIFAAIFFAVLLVGGEQMQRGAGVPFGMVYILQAIIVLSVIGIERWMRTRRK